MRLAWARKYYEKDLIASAVFFAIVVWFIGWQLALLMAAILFVLNLGVDYFVKERRLRRRQRVDEAFLRKEAERIEDQRDDFHYTGQ